MKHRTPNTVHQTLSVVLATRNEESNIGPCLESTKNIADEIVVIDEYSTDKTREVAKSFGARVFKYKHRTNFHETKQKAIDKATSDWILQLDADERVTKELAVEIKKVVNSNEKELQKRVLSHPGTKRSGVIGSHKSEILSASSLQNDNINHQPSTINHRKTKLFKRHQLLIEQREGKLGIRNGKVVAFFIPRVNFFLKKPLIHAGVYPDGVIRLFKKGKARLPGKSVHELMEVDGEVGWLFNDLEHNESPSMYRYIERMNRYTDLHAEEFKLKYKNKTKFVHLLYFSFIKPCTAFLNLYLRHKGVADGFRGFLWSYLSAMHYPIAYYKYWVNIKRSD